MRVALIVLLVAVTCAACKAQESDIDEPSYVDADSCPEAAKAVIGQQRLPLSQIHFCGSDRHDVEGVSVELVLITYGEAEDCDSGCFYSEIAAVVADDAVDRVPFKYPDDLMQSLFFAQQPFWDRTIYTECLYPSPDVDVSLGAFGEEYGWRYQIRGSTYAKSGSAFQGMRDDGTEYWDFSELLDTGEPWPPQPCLTATSDPPKGY